MKSKDFWMYAFFSILLISIGGTMNVIAMDSNDCEMPVKTDYPEQYESNACYFGFEEFSEVNKPYLSDFIKVPYTKGRILTNSIGDIIAFIGMILLVVVSILNLIGLWKGKRIKKKEDLDYS